MTQTLSWTRTGVAETITQAGDTSSFAYTVDDERVLRVDPDGTKKVTLGGWYEHTIPLTGSATETSYYSFAGQRLALNQDDGTSSEDWYVFADRLASLGVFHQPDTATTIRRWYGPWGTIRAGTGTPPTEISYTGQRRDPTGLYHYQARLYDPQHATFATPDTIVGDPAQALDHNRYSYTRNNPTNLIDPDGHCPRELTHSRVMCTEHDLEVAQKGFSQIGAKLAPEYQPKSYTASDVVQDFTFDPDPCLQGSSWCVAEAAGLFGVGWLGKIAEGISRFFKWGDEVVAGVSRAPSSSVLPKPSVSNTKLSNIVDDLYKGTTSPHRVGTGTTADAVRNELATGLPTGGTLHTQKAQQYSNALQKLLKQDLSYHDRMVAQSLLDDLQRALKGQP